MDKAILIPMLNASWQWTIVVAIIALLAHRFRHSCAIRHALWLAALVAMPTLFILDCIVPGVSFHSVHLEPTTQQRLIQTTIPASADGQRTEVIAPSLNPLSSTDTIAPSFSIPWTNSFLLIWGLGAIWCLLRFASGLRRLRHLYRFSQSPSQQALQMLNEVRSQFSIEEQIALRTSTQLRVPISLGWKRPCILLPNNSGMNQLKPVLIHELAHLQRRDWLVNLLIQAIGIMFYFHPLYYLVRRRLAEAREQICDDWVIRTTGQRANYADCLVDVMAQRASQTRLALSLGHRHSRLSSRIKWILDDNRLLNTHLSRKAIFAIFGIVAAVLPVMSVAQIFPGRRVNLSSTAVEIAPRGNVVIDGTVRFTDSGEPIENAVVWAVYHAYPSEEKFIYGPTTTDKQGYYRLEQLPDDKGIQIQVASKGYQSEKKYLKLRPSVPPFQPNFSLRPAFVFEGRVSAPRKIESLHVTAETMDFTRARSKRGAAFHGKVAVNSNGRYRVVLTHAKRKPVDADFYPSQESESLYEYVPQGESADFRLRLSTEGFEPFEVENVRFVRGQAISDINPSFDQRSATVSGRVVDTNGNPVSRLSLSISRVKIKTGRGSEWVRVNGRQITTTTGTAGIYHFDDVPSGTILLDLGWSLGRERAYRMVSLQNGPFISFANPIMGTVLMVQQGANMEDIDITVARRIHIRGRILFADGTPLTSSLVRLYEKHVSLDGNGSGSGSSSMNTDAEGYYDFFEDDPARYTLTVEYENLSATRQHILAEAGVQIDGVDLVLDGNAFGAQSAEQVEVGPAVAPPSFGWMINVENGHAYKVIAGDTWEECKAAAVKLGGYLVTINDAEEQKWLIKTFGGTFHWIGLSDAEKEGDWRWMNGEPVEYTNWRAPDPNNRFADRYRSGEDYAVMNWIDLGKWGDVGPSTPDYSLVGRAIVERDTPP